MIPSHQYPSRFHSTTNVLLILLLYIFHTTGVSGANFTIVNRCSETIWAVVDDQSSSPSAYAGVEVPVNSSLTLRKPDGWNGRLWGKTGCILTKSGKASCATGDGAVVTLAEFQLGTAIDYYDVTLVDGYNLPLVVKPIGGSGSCEPAGCTEDLNKRCPPELRTEGGAACQGSCSVWVVQGSCGPNNYTRLFKEVCPRAQSYPTDDTTSLFTCGAAPDYSIIFCPPHDSLPEMPPASSPSYPPHSSNDNPQQRKVMPPAPIPSSANNNPQRRKVKNHVKQIITIVSVIISCAIIVSIIICCFLKRRHSHNIPKQKCNRDVENLLLQNGSLAPKRYQYSEIKKITKSLSDTLGRGGYGSVYKGMLPDGRLVAVKVLIETDSNGEEFINEVVSISRTSHVNIVSLLGFCYERNRRALIYEFMPNKSLDKFLGGNGDCFLDLKKLYEIAVGVAKGLEYLHTGCTTRIVHFDIKPQNILLDEEFCPKISDFGLAKLCKKKQSILSVMGTRGTIGYIAPEVFSRNFGGVSHKSDVYSYGMMLLEMAGAKEIVDNGANAIQSSENYFPDKIYEQIIIDDVNNVDDSTMEEEEEARKKMFMVGFWCIQTIPSERPSISKVVEMLEGSVVSIQIPPKPLLFHRPLNPHKEPSSSPFSTHVETENSPQD